MDLVAPFPYFGGKRKVAPAVWSRFGEVRNYVEPFCGSAAMLLGAPRSYVHVVASFYSQLRRVFRLRDVSRRPGLWQATVCSRVVPARHCY